MSNKPRLNNNLTYEQFKSLAEREPSLDGNWIYRLEHVHYGAIVSYPEFEIWREECLFLTLSDATTAMKKMAGCDDTYRFEITQLPIGKLNDNGASWVYDRNGKLLDYLNTALGNESDESIFCGRPQSRIRFRKGDIVEVVGRDKVNLAVIAADCLDVDWYWDMYCRSQNSYNGSYYADASDDCYYILTGPGYTFHEHSPSLAVMKPSEPIPDDIREYFEHCLECADMEECTDKYKSVIFFEEKMDEYSSNSVRIKYDKETKIHCLIRFIHDDIDGTYTEMPFKDEELEPITQWLGEVMYGKTRLWYIIRYWNEKCCDDEEAFLSLNIPISKFLEK